MVVYIPQLLQHQKKIEHVFSNPVVVVSIPTVRQICWLRRMSVHGPSSHLSLIIILKTVHWCSFRICFLILTNLIGKVPT